MHLVFNNKFIVNFFDNKIFVIIFDSKFIVMKNIVGAPARGENFFPRPGEVAKIVSRIESGNNLQIAAPRRVGKTSILFYLLDNQIEGYTDTYVYIDTERVDQEQEFYKKILKEILRAEPVASSNRLQKLFKDGQRFLSKIKSVKVLGAELSFQEQPEEVNYYEELTNFLTGFELEEETKLVLLLDEFPQTILNIVAANKGDTKAATKFLQSNRELRQNPEISRKVKFIYTGSVGLNHTVAAIQASAFVNDLNSIEVEPLSREEAIELVAQLLEAKKITIQEEAVDHLLAKIEWFIPFHIQLAIQEVLSLAYQTKQVDPQMVEQAFENIVAARNNNHFEHYASRLKSQFKGSEFKYVDQLLQQLATEGTLNKAQLADLAFGHGQQEDYRRILEILVYDGYINNTGTPTTYRFNSPIVRMWWQRYIC
jgi:uncharacterized protein